MLINDFLPAAHLKAFVQCFRIVHFEFGKMERIPFKAYPPKPEQCLHFFLRDPFAVEKDDHEKKLQPNILLAGQQTSLVKQYSGNHLLDVQIVFQPTAVFRLTGLVAPELTNQFIDATLLFPGAIRETFEKLQQTNDYNHMLRLVEDFTTMLVRHAQKDCHFLDDVSQQMRQCAGNVTMDALAKQSYLCTKQFKRKFLERTGVNPKTYARIIRFNKAYNLKNRFSNRSWDRIAADCGYTDYQHLSKDYKDFTDLTPYELHQLECQSPERVLQLADSIYRLRAIL